MPILCATPYDIDAGYFYFQTLEEYDEKAKKHRNAYGQPVEEYEIQFIDGNELEQRLADRNLNQATLKQYFDLLEEVDNWCQNAQAGLLYRMKNEGLTYEQAMEISEDEAFERVVLRLEGYQADYAVADELGHYYADECGLLEGIPDEVRKFFDYRAYGKSFLDGGYDYEEIFGNTWVFADY